MKCIIILAAFFLFSYPALSQSNDTSIVTIRYSAFSAKDAVSKSKEKEDFELNIGQRLIKYHSYTKFKRDSILQDAERKSAKPSPELKGVLMTNCSGIQIYRKRNTDTAIVFTDIAGDNFYFDDNYKHNWHLLADTATVLGYPCQMAKTTFRGREYIAYFSDAMPIQSGPWKFDGLPGLILKVTETNGLFENEATMIDYNKRVILNPEIEKKKYIATTRMRFREQEAIYYQNPVEYLRVVKGYNFIIKGEQPAKTITRPLMQESE